MSDLAGPFRQRDDRPPDCPAPDLVQAARAGVLPADVQDVIAAHISGCVVCRMLGESLESLATGPTDEESRRILQRIQTEVTGTKPRTVGAGPWRWAVAAALVVTVGTGVWLAVRSNVTDRNPAPSPTPGAASVFELGPPVILRPEVPADRSRGSANAAQAEALAATLVPYRAGRFAEAARALTAFVSRYPQSAEGYFYLGVAELARSRDAVAAVALESAERLTPAQSELSREVGWHLAVAYHRLGQRDKAWERLAALCRDPRGGSRRACAGLRELAPSLRLHGLVTDLEGRPLEGVRLGEHSGRVTPDFLVTSTTGFGATTDANGRYQVSGVPWSASATLLFRASRVGYFTATAILQKAPETKLDFRLHPWRFIKTGEAVRGTTADEPICEIRTESCQRYAVRIERTGILEVSLETSTRKGMDLYVEAPDGAVYGPQLEAPLRLTLPAFAGSVFQIRVLSFNETRDFALTTRLR